MFAQTREGRSRDISKKRLLFLNFLYNQHIVIVFKIEIPCVKAETGLSIMWYT